MRARKAAVAYVLVLVTACLLVGGTSVTCAAPAGLTSSYLLMDQAAQSEMISIYQSRETDTHQLQACGDSISESGYFLAEYFHPAWGESEIELEVQGQPPLDGNESQTAASGEIASFCIDGWGDPGYRSGLVDVVLDSDWYPALATIKFGTNDLMVFYRDELMWADDLVACELNARSRYISQMRANAQWLMDRGIVPIFVSFIPVTDAAADNDYYLTYESHHDTGVLGQELHVVWRNALYDLADEMNVPVFDAYRLFADNSPASLTDDGVHPNMDGYSLINREFEKVYRDLDRFVFQGEEQVFGTKDACYLAEGTTDWGYDCYVTIANPHQESVGASITYMTGSGPVSGGDVNLPPMSQSTVNPRDTLGDRDFSTKVEYEEGKQIAVDRTMTWTGAGALSPDGHCSVGVTDASTTWYLPEGSSRWGFETWLLIQNPNEQDADCTVTYMIEGADPITVTETVPASSRKSYSMKEHAGEADASIKVECALPVIPERAMYRNNRRGGHDSIGTTTPANSYYLAEGTTDFGFTTYVLIQNPNDAPTDVNITYMTGGGPLSHPENPITMDPSSRKTVRVNDYLDPADFSVQVTGTSPIVAERAMYWGDGGELGEACHDSIGLAEPHATFYLPDGETSSGRETWTLVQNPNGDAVEVRVTYLTPGGTNNATFTDTIEANSRKTYELARHVSYGRASIMVECLTAGRKIMCERAMYWNGRGAGTDTIGGYSD